MQGDRSAPASGSARLPTLADLIAAGELTCSAAQVARLLNVSKPTVIAAARRGELPGRQVGKQWRFSCKELARMFGEHLPAEGGDADAA
jgi:excisionase family DNA binding protein